MIATILGFITTAFSLLFGTIFRGIASILVMALAAFVWKRVNTWKGTVHARPHSILFFPIIATALGALYLAFFLLRITLWSVPAAFLAILLGLALGFYSGTTTHLYNTRWNRIMIRPRGRLLVAWFGSLVLAAFFRILPFGWLSTPTMALFLAMTVAVVTAHIILYLRWKELQVTGHKKVDGARIDISLAPEEAAVLATFLDLYGPRQAPIQARELVEAVRRAERPKSDLALSVLTGVRAAWDSLKTSPDRIQAVIDGLVAAGILAPGLAPGPMTARLLAIGSVSRTLTLGATRFDTEGRSTTAESTRVIVQAGGASFLFDDGDDAIRLREIQGADIIEEMKTVFLTPAHRTLIR